MPPRLNHDRLSSRSKALQRRITPEPSPLDYRPSPAPKQAPKAKREPSAPKSLWRPGEQPPLTLDPLPDTLVLWTDGAAINNPNGRTSSAFVAVMPTGRIVEFARAHSAGSNQQSESLALLYALERLPSRWPIWCVTDSQYVLHGVRRCLDPDKGMPVANRGLWFAIRDALQDHPGFRATWIKGHAGIDGNERVDSIASEAVHNGPWLPLPRFEVPGGGEKDF